MSGWICPQCGEATLHEPGEAVVVNAYWAPGGAGYRAILNGNVVTTRSDHPLLSARELEQRVQELAPGESLHWHWPKHKPRLMTFEALPLQERFFIPRGLVAANFYVDWPIYVKNGHQSYRGSGEDYLTLRLWWGDDQSEVYPLPGGEIPDEFFGVARECGTENAEDGIEAAPPMAAEPKSEADPMNAFPGGRWT